MMTDDTFWQQPPSVRDEQAPSMDSHCLVCGKSLEGKPFIYDLFMGPQVDVAGMHLQCAYSLSMRILRDLAAVWRLDPAQLKRFVEIYSEDQQARAPRPADIPAQ
jgi:hypothetical protein